MNPEDAVLDEIDRLVDESLATPYSERSGYDNDINQPECRCGADWHGLPWGGCPGTESEGPVDDPWARKRARIGMVAVSPYRDATENGDEWADEGVAEWIEIGRIAPESPVFTYHEMLAGADSAFTTPWLTFTTPRLTEWMQANLLELFRDSRDSFTITVPPVDQPEEPETPQQRALPRPSTTPPMWTPRADGRRRR